MRAIILLSLAVLLSVGCVSVGTRVCALHQPGCDFTDHVMTIWPSGPICPTWDVRFSQYNPTGEPTDQYGVTPSDDSVRATLTEASKENVEVHVWYAGEKYFLYKSCSSDFPLVIYAAELVNATNQSR